MDVRFFRNELESERFCKCGQILTAIIHNMKSIAILPRTEQMTRIERVAGFHERLHRSIVVGDIESEYPAGHKDAVAFDQRFFCLSRGEMFKDLARKNFPDG